MIGSETARMISELMTQFLVCVLQPRTIKVDGPHPAGSDHGNFIDRTMQRSLIRLPELRLVLLAMLVCSIAGPVAAETDQAASGHLRAAEQALQQHEYKNAAAEYLRAATLSDDPDTARQATRVAFVYGFNADALNAALRWTELDADSDEALLYVAQLQLRSGKFRDARRSFEKLIKRGEEPPADRLLGLVLILSREDPEDAYRLVSQLAKPYRDSASAHYAVGVMALQAGDHKAAGNRAQQAIEIRPDWIKPRLLYARSLLLAGREEDAIAYVAQIIGDDPDPDPEARLELAIMYLSAQRDDDALSQVNQVLLEQPSRADALRMMAIINFRQENLDAARADFQDLLSSGQYTSDALYYLARIADYRGETERALSLYAQVNNGQHAVISQRRAGGIIAREAGFEAALDHLQRFAEINPNYAIDMIQAQAWLLTSEQQYERALQMFDRMVSYRPDSESAVLGRGEVLLRMGRTEEAISDYRAAARKWPNSANVLNALGYTLTGYSDKYREAERLIGKALKLQPDSAAIIDSHGWVLYRLGKHEEALAELKRAWAMLKDPEVGAHVAEVLWKLGRLDEAIAILEEAEELDPAHPAVKEVRERIASGSD